MTCKCGLPMKEILYESNCGVIAFWCSCGIAMTFNSEGKDHWYIPSSLKESI